MIRTQRTRLRSTVALAADAIAPAWPLDTFVAVNPLLGFEEMPFAEATARAADLFRARVLPGGERPQTRACDAAIGTSDTLADWCAAFGWGDAVAFVDERTGRWLAAYADRGTTAWPMPHRARGFFAAWKRLARHENALARDGGAYRRAVDALPARADDALLANLEALGIPPERWTGYLQRHLAQCAGWSGYVKQRAENGADPGLDLIALLAVRTWYERCAVGAAAERQRVEPTFAGLRAWLHADVHALARAHVADPAAHAGALARLDEREQRFANDLLARIAATPARAAAPPDAQIVFCIDVRSELLRRALEASGAIETFGFAGFFGVPLRFRAFDAPVAIAQAPVLMRASTVVDERPDAARADALRRAALRAQAREALVNGALGHPLGAFAGVEVAGPFAAMRAALRTFGARRRTPRTHREPLAIDGFRLDERTFLAEAALRIMGLTHDFAPLVVFCGHGGGTVNNAFASSLDCGACGGNRGLVNARVAAAICNDPAVRAALAGRGIAIPETTWFVAAEHDTTRDTLAFDVCDAPAAARANVAAMERIVAVATQRARAERLPTLPPVPLGAGDARARAGDWAQVRPEWALARNAAFVVGPRALTRDVDLDGRCFLHSYDPAADADGAALEQILTAPLIVAEWINLQYFFATVDPERFGSGDKVLQQPVGGIGVVAGNGGDLRLGLPLQSTTFGAEPYHEPLRLLAIVVAPLARIDAIVARQQVLQRLFDHRWVSLVAIDPADGRAHRYAGARRWHPHQPTETAVCSPIN